MRTLLVAALLGLSHCLRLQGRTGERPNHRYTISINSYGRGCLREALAHWRTCRPAQIRIVWNRRDVPEGLQKLEERAVLVVDRQNGSSPMNRFRPHNFSTEAVFTVDEDVWFGCKTMEQGARAFYNDTQRMVGFGPRRFFKPRPKHQAYEKGDDAFMRGKMNALFVTKGTFFNRKFLDMLWEPQYEDLRRDVDQLQSGEDLLASFVYAQRVGLPVLALGGPIEPTRSNCSGIKKNDKARDLNPHKGQMLTKLFRFFGEDVLQNTSNQGFINAQTGDPLDSVKKWEVIEKVMRGIVHDKV